MSDVYVVTTGAYSDLSVDSVFTTELDAMIYCEELNKRDPLSQHIWTRVDLDPPLPSVVRALTHDRDSCLCDECVCSRCGERLPTCKCERNRLEGIERWRRENGRPAFIPKVYP